MSKTSLLSLHLTLTMEAMAILESHRMLDGYISWSFQCKLCMQEGEFIDVFLLPYKNLYKELQVRF